MENDYSDTLGAGSYPTPPESKEKLFEFKIICTCKASVVIQADTQEEAEELLKNASQYDLKYEYDLDINDLGIEEVEEVIEMEN